MKKRFFLLAAITLVFVLFFGACKHESDDKPHTSPNYLEGTWKSENEVFTFTIGSDLGFACEFEVDTGPALVTGELDPRASNLGPNDYIMRNLQTDTADENYRGNTDPVMAGLNAMNGVPVTITPNGEKSRFTLSSTNFIAQMFFGRDGDFTKQP